jgi:hypothetical protein
MGGRIVTGSRLTLRSQLVPLGAKLYLLTPHSTSWPH